MNLRLLVLSILLMGALSVAQGTAFALSVGDELPSASLEDLSGDSFDPSDLSGAVGVLYFLGSGCGICVDIATQIESDLMTKYDEDELVVLAIDSLDGSKEELTRLRDEAGVRFPFLQNGSSFRGACDLEWHALVIVDANGIVRYVEEGADVSIYDSTAMNEVIEQYVGRAQAAVEKTWGEIKSLFDR